MKPGLTYDRREIGEHVTRGRKDAKPLLEIKDLAPALRSDQIVGAEVRSSDDKIVGEVRNIIFGAKDGRDGRHCRVRRIFHRRQG